jgi:hypothetical protein
VTSQEEGHGLLTDTATIGTRNGWEARLCDAGLTLKGHRLVKRTEERTDVSMADSERRP